MIDVTLPTNSQNNRSHRSRFRVILYLTIGTVASLLLVIGTLVGLTLVKSPQDERQQASSPSGTATVSISPTNVQLRANGSQTFTVSFNPQNNVISGVSVRLQYESNSSQSLLTAGQPSVLINQGDSNWNCPVVTTNTSSSRVNIDVACIYLSSSGFTGQTDVNLFSVVTTAGSIATTNPIAISFDPTQTSVIRKSDYTDVAAIPLSVAYVTILGNSPTNPPPSPTTFQNNPTSPTPGASISPYLGSISPSPTIRNTSPIPTGTAGYLTPTPIIRNLTPTIANVSQMCNSTCIASRDCSEHLDCISGLCRRSQCPIDTSCLCEDYNPINATSSANLPNSGSISQTILNLILGIMLLTGSSSILLTRISSQK